MSAPKPAEGTFPYAWKAWRKLRSGETLKKGDRVLSQVSYRGSIIRYHQDRVFSYPVVAQCFGDAVNPAREAKYPAGWYYRRTK